MEIKRHDNVYINDNLNIDLKDFLNQVFINFEKEINLTAEAFYELNKLDDDIKGSDKIFSSIERTWLGLFNNALVRYGQNIPTLQEFSVWSDKFLIGRCDLLFRYPVQGVVQDIIVESKSREFFPYRKLMQNRTEYGSILTQAYNYYYHEKSYYNHPILLMCMIFEWIRDSSCLQQAINLMADNDTIRDEETSFLTLYHGQKRGLFIYGQIIDITSFETKYLPQTFQEK